MFHIYKSNTHHSLRGPSGSQRVLFLVTSVTCPFQGFDDNSGGTFDRTVFGWVDAPGLTKKRWTKIGKKCPVKWRCFFKLGKTWICVGRSMFFGQRRHIHKIYRLWVDCKKYQPIGDMENSWKMCVFPACLPLPPVFFGNKDVSMEVLQSGILITRYSLLVVFFEW